MSRGPRGRGGGFRFNEGDWTCPNCDNVNFARRTQCNRCGEERKYDVKKIKKGGIEIGKMAAEKSKGLFSADDWMCKSCGNVNWARRNDCNVCNTPKLNIQEERTGHGGGFNEREGVEYKEKEDSDGEFDEFGRKKKKYRGKLPSGSTIELKKTESDAEEEEESGEEGDATQYDLDADEEEDDDDDDAGNYDLEASSDDEKSEKKRSRSRSRDGKNGNRSSSSRSRSRSRGRSSSSSSSDSRHRRRRKHRREKSRSRSRSRSPHHRHSRSSSRDRHHKRH